MLRVHICRYFMCLFLTAKIALFIPGSIHVHACTCMYIACSLHDQLYLHVHVQCTCTSILEKLVRVH